MASNFRKLVCFLFFSPVRLSSITYSSIGTYHPTIPLVPPTFLVCNPRISFLIWFLCFFLSFLITFYIILDHFTNAFVNFTIFSISFSILECHHIHLFTEFSFLAMWQIIKDWFYFSCIHKLCWYTTCWYTFKNYCRVTSSVTSLFDFLRLSWRHQQRILPVHQIWGGMVP